MVKATLANMKKCRNAGLANIFAYSFETKERYSADPSDYWNLEEDHCLADMFGEEMVLARETRTISEIKQSDITKHKKGETE